MKRTMHWPILGKGARKGWARMGRARMVGWAKMGRVRIGWTRMGGARGVGFAKQRVGPKGGAPHRVGGEARHGLASRGAQWGCALGVGAGARFTEGGRPHWESQGVKPNGVRPMGWGLPG